MCSVDILQTAGRAWGEGSEVHRFVVWCVLIGDRGRCRDCGNGGGGARVYVCWMIVSFDVKIE